MKKAAIVSLVLLFYTLHQDLWFWDAARPLIFGFLPVGLAYHLGFSIGSSMLMVVLVALAWPAQLEAEAGELDAGAVRKDPAP